ncbi:hypothetical protein AGLY_004770 [Aphis glycines]|uniref:Uncharacterized protein n=1 Tax=Aphis glycines TaxID=307491 RepID=A0A6G0TUU9_APHGL|nr:hypothetical protein AGLY_004770 [Aphis glycines]
MCSSSSWQALVTIVLACSAVCAFASDVSMYVHLFTTSTAAAGGVSIKFNSPSPSLVSMWGLPQNSKNVTCFVAFSEGCSKVFKISSGPGNHHIFVFHVYFSECSKCSEELLKENLRNILIIINLSFRIFHQIFTRPLNEINRLHIQESCCKSLKILGFIKRISSEFKLHQSLEILFCSLVRPILEYGSVIWDPHLSIDSLMIEWVQGKFLSFVAFSLKIPCPPHDYEPVHIALSLSSLTDRRRNANITFLKKLLSDVIDCPTLLSQTLSIVNFTVIFETILLNVCNVIKNLNSKINTY